MLDAELLHLQLENDQFAAGQPIALSDDLSQVSLLLESPNPASHSARLNVSASIAGSYQLSGPSGALTNVVLAAGEEVVLDLPVGAGGISETFSLIRQ